MDRLSNDHRTATLAGDRGARRQLEKVADRLFADLRSNERAEWVAISTGMAPALVVATDSRLLTISMIGRSTQAIERPFTIVLGKKRLIGQSVDVFDARGLCLSLLLQEPDLRALQMTGGASSPSGSTTQAPPPPPSAPPDPAGTAPPPGSTGAWRWGRPVTSWQEAELLAAAHMVDLGFSGATVTPGGADAGLDVIAHDAAAQVKYHEGPTGRPDIQRLIGRPTASGVGSSTRRATPPRRSSRRTGLGLRSSSSRRRDSSSPSTTRRAALRRELQRPTSGLRSGR